MEENFEIRFDDLIKETQERLLKFLELEGPEEGNFEISPVAIIPKPEKEEE